MWVASSSSVRKVRPGHAAAAPLDPPGAALLAGEPHVHLGGGFGEREVVGPHARPGPRTEQGARERVERATQVGHRQPLVYRQTLHLVEDRGVGGVELVGTEGPARACHVDRRLAVEHRADLHRGGVRAQHLAAALGRDVEGVLQRARRMIGQEVQRVEVVVLRLDLGPLGDLPAHRHEHVRDLLGDDRDGMLGSHRGASGRDRQVERLGHEDGGVALGLQFGQAPVICLLHAPAGHVDRLAGRRLLLLAQRAQAPPRQGDRTAVAQMRRLGGGQRVEVGGSRERGLGVGGVAGQ